MIATDSNGRILSPAPGWLLVAPEERETAVGEVKLAVKGGEYHEGVVMAVGLAPKGHRLQFSPGDTVIYARFTAVEAKVDEMKCRLVQFHAVAGIRRSQAKRSPLWAKIVASAKGAMFSIGVASGILIGIGYEKIREAWKKA